MHTDDGKAQAVHHRHLIPPKWHIVRRLYDWVLHWADTPWGTPAMAIAAFVESSFFSAPPDLMLLALGMGRRNRCFFYAGIAALFSVLGAMFGYFLGHEFFGLVNRTLAWTLGPASWYGVFHEGAGTVEILGYTFYAYAPASPYAPDTSIFLHVRDLYNNHEFITVFLAGLLPFPFQVFTIAAGYFDIPFSTLVAATALGRGLRFAVVGGLVYALGPAVKRLIERYFDVATIILIALCIVAFILIEYVF